MKRILALVTLFLIIFNYSNKAHSIEPDEFIQSTVSRAAKTLSGGFTKEERIEKLKEIARDTVDIRGIGFYSLGSHRKNLNDDQKRVMTPREAIDLGADYLVIGRPITKSDDINKTLNEIYSSIQ